MNPLSSLKKLFKQIGTKLKAINNIEGDPATLVRNSKPIVFVNKPILTPEDDVLFYSTQAEAIISAVSQGANVIGVIADYGAGKTSLTQLLRLQDNKAKESINIYLWDSLSTKQDSIGSSEIKPVAAITRSFLYQLACGDRKDGMFARNINWRLSRNFGVLSISPTKKNFWYYIIAAAICFIGPKAALLSFPNLIAWETFILNVLSPWGALAIAIWGLIETNVAFSLWDSQGKRQPESSDTYSLFSEIVKKIFADNARRYVFIEDLDRIKDKAVVIEFLKEIYKFNALLDDKFKERVIFVVSVMPENKLTNTSPEDEYGPHLYSKIFDYLVVLPAIHIHDHESVLLDILKTHEDEISSILGEPLAHKMPSQLVWLIKGDNLTVRDIKNRLNICFSIYERLRKRQDSDESLDLDIQLGKCSAVAYLLDKYPDHISCLMQNETGFDSLVALSTQLHAKNSYDTVYDLKIKESIEKKLLDTLDDPKSASIDLRNKMSSNAIYSKTDRLFQDDVVALLIGHLIEEDYHQYFYTYPKNSRIYKVYESRVKSLISSNGDISKDLLSDIRSVRNSSPEIIIEQIQFLLNLKPGLPSCVFSSKDLFEIVFENFPNNVSDELVRLLNWEPRKIEDTKMLLYFLEAEVGSAYHKSLFEEIAVLLVEKLKNESVEAISTARQVLIRILGIDMIHFAQLYQGTGMPLIQAEEISLVSDPDLIIAFTNTDQIDETSALNVAEWLDRQFESSYLSDLDKIIEKCLSCNSDTAENAIGYLKQNSRYNESIFCSVLESEVCDNDVIVDYINGFSPAQISQKGWNLVDDYMVFGGYNEKIRKWLISKKKYKAYLLDLSEQDSILPSCFTGLDEKVLLSALNAIFKYDPDRFIWLRYRLPGILMRAIPSIYHSPYPFVTDYELHKCSSQAMAISITNFTGLEQKNCKYVAAHLTRLSSGKLLCKKLFDDIFAEEDIDIEFIADDSRLVGMDHREILDRFITTVAEGVIFTVLARAGMNPRTLQPAFTFESIAYFDTPLVASQLGCATRDISEMVLRQIERSVRAIERQARDNIANSSQERENDVESHPIQPERSETDGTNLSTEWGLSAPEPDTGEPADRTAGQIRADAQGVSQDEPQGAIQRPITLWEFNGAPGDDRSTSARADQRDSAAAGRRPGRERADEGGESAPVDTPDEQPPSDGRGDGAAGDAVHLISEAEQLNLLETEADRETASFLLQQDIDAELLSGSGFEHGKNRILAFYRTNPDAKVAVTFLKDEYGIGGHSFTFHNGSSGFVDHGGKGLSFRQWGTEQQKTLSWSQVHRRIAELIRADRYRVEEEPVHVPTPIEPEPVEPIQAGKNFRISDDSLGTGGPKAKFAFNVAAIRTLKQIEAEQRLTTQSEQEILARYVGWGGIADAFDATKDAWQHECTELRALLTDEEYRSARESVLNAHYTSPTVIKAMYDALERIGFSTGNVLEPACGIGNFFGLVPESMSESHFYGVELDGITGRIAQLLYPETQIAIQGFEAADYPDHFFDVAIGNVPFGDYGIADQRYDKQHFLIHDYFFAKALDKVRPGGVVAFVTSSGTMDKKNPQVRKYLAQRAELIGAVRLPNNAFLANAGTSVVADILFLQKRDRPIEIEPNWVHLGKSPEGFAINQYFVDHPDHVLGELTSESTQYGKQEYTVKPIEGASLAEKLHSALSSLHAEIGEPMRSDELEEAPVASIPASPDVRNFSFTLVNDVLYYRENSRMNPVEVSVTAEHRIQGMIELRDCTRRLIELQLNGNSDAEIATEQARLNELYDAFTSKYGLINSRGNDMAFSDDSSYCLLCSLEILDEEGNLARKADMFTKRTIRQQIAITHADTASEVLAISMSERARVDLPYMSELTGLSEEQIVTDLAGVIFRDYGALEPQQIAWAFFDPKQFPMVTTDEYLSGNVRDKLIQVRKLREMLSEHGADETIIAQLDTSNAALEQVQPQALTASEIDVRVGSTWIPPEIVESFMHELFQTSGWARSRTHILFSSFTANWTITNKTADYGSVPATVTYGTTRANGYRTLEDTLNLRDVRIFDTVRDADGKEQRVLNKKETILAQQKQQLIKEAFSQWIWRDADRRELLTTLYNERFNSTRPREYDGSHIRFVGMNPEIELRPHQADSVARVLYGGNALLAHVVGAGKTFAMTAAAMELKRLGLCQKSLFVVPNHLTEQWAAEFLQLYPSANILVATKRDFERTRRRTFCSRIATGDYDAVIIGHSQFEKIPMSLERQQAQLQEQLDEVLSGIAEAKEARAERFTIKQMERARKSIKLKLDKLNSTTHKDDVITFEELGVDRLFVDEAHGFKNLSVFTKMRNVAGISQTEAQKSSDLFLKCRYMDAITGGRGVVFATGTPVSNSMTELYTMQRYLQYGTLRARGLQHFDAWASTFGETVTSVELSPEGTGYRARTRFARFFNLPELITMFKEVADIKTADMLRLPVPDVEYHNIRLEPSDLQRSMVAGLADRAERVRNQMIDPSVDNMLTITNDGRKLALDQRMLNGALPDDPNSKVNACLRNVLEVWQSTQAQRRTQLVFCDLSTPKGFRAFSAYDDLRQKLISGGVPAEEIAFIHDANTEIKKAELFAKVRAGQVRILLGSTAKMGSGTNVQRLLYAEHHLDIPWRPADLEQREGRAIRQGNTCPTVHIYRYVTEGTFDAYMWATLENKQKFIGQIMTSKSPVRSCEDVDETALTYAEVKALATGDERIKEKMDLEVDVAKLKLVRANYHSQKYALEDALLKRFPQEIAREKARIAGYAADIERLAAHDANPTLGIELGGIIYTERKDAGAALLATCKAQTSPEQKEIGTYRGFDLFLSFDALTKAFRLSLKGALSHTVELGDDLFGNLQRIDNVLGALPDRLETAKERLSDLEQQKSATAEEIKKPFLQEEELNEKCVRLATLDAELNIDKERGESVAALEETDSDNTMEQETDQEERTSVLSQLREYAESEILPARQMRVCAAMEER